METTQPESPELSDNLRPLSGAPSATILPLMIAPLQPPAQLLEMVHRSLATAFWRFSPLRFVPPPALAMMRMFTPPMLAAAIPGLSGRSAARPRTMGAPRQGIANPLFNPVRERAALHAPRTAPAR